MMEGVEMNRIDNSSDFGPLATNSSGANTEHRPLGEIKEQRGG